MIATATKGSWVQERFPELVGLMVAGGFAMTLAELLLMGHTEKSQNIAVLMSGLGMVATIVGLVVAPRFRAVFAGLLVVVAASGLFGTYEHIEEAMEHKEKAAKATSALVIENADFDRSEADERHERGEKHDEEGEHGPPPLAPLSVSGLALLGSLGLIASRR